MVHDYGPGRRFASVHVEMAAEEDTLKSHDVIDNIERDFHDQDNIHLVVHYDPIVTGDAALGTAREWVREQVVRISPQLSMHDFRMVTGPSHTNLIFDVVVPADFSMTDAALRAAIQQALDAVSYTHLDVYKRQRWCRGSSGPGCPYRRCPSGPWRWRRTGSGPRRGRNPGW